MNTLFTKTMKLTAPVNGWMAICQRTCHRSGIAGVKF